MEQFAFQQTPKTSNEGALCVDDDKLFQTRGPATQNARSPMVVRGALGMSSLAEAVVKFRVNYRGGNGAGCFEVKVWADTAIPRIRAGVLRDVPVYSPRFRRVLIPACHRGRLRLNRPGCLVLRRGGLLVQIRSPTQVLTRPSVE